MGGSEVPNGASQAADNPPGADMSIRLCSVALLIFAATATHAAVSVGGRTFADNAFADAASLPAVNYLLWDGVTSNVENNSTDAAKAAAAMLDTPVGNPGLATSTFGACAIGQTESQCGVLRLTFNQVWVVNGAGADFTVFDINNSSDVKAMINGTTLVRSSVLAGTTPRPPDLGPAPWTLNAIDFDLSDFGLAAGARINSIDFHWGYGETTQIRNGFALVGALNTVPVPEPATWWLMSLGVLALTTRVRRRDR
jgi:PEP-CTERM motif